MLQKDVQHLHGMPIHEKVQRLSKKVSEREILEGGQTKNNKKMIVQINAA